MIISRLSEMLGIKHPIILGGMAYVSNAHLVAAVSDAGGLGVLGGGGLSSQGLGKEIRKVRDLTGNPFGVNLLIFEDNVRELIDVVLDHGIDIIFTGGGNPSKFMNILKNASSKVFPVVSSVALAKRLEDKGADGVVAEGYEAGGHVDESTTFSLLPQVCEGVDIPVIAAGGIADGRGLAAAISLGADAVLMGTRFLASLESEVHISYKNVILKAGDRDTVVTGRSIGHPVRCIRNQLTRRLSELERAPNPDSKRIMEIGRGGLEVAIRQGELKRGSLMAGQISGLIREIMPAREIIATMVQDAEAILRNAISRFKD